MDRYQPGNYRPKTINLRAKMPDNLLFVFTRGSTQEEG
jgi:hypothetical protein